MGKVQKKAVEKKGTAASKFAKADYEPQNAKERVEHELHLLKVRKQAITTKAPTVHKVKKATTKKGITAKKQKKIARALMVADKVEKRVEVAQSKAEKRKLGKQLWD